MGSEAAPAVASEAIPEDEDYNAAPTEEQLAARLQTLLDTCTYVVFNYTRRGLFDRDKLIVLTLLTFHIMLKVCLHIVICWQPVVWSAADTVVAPQLVASNHPCVAFTQGHCLYSASNHAGCFSFD